MNARFLLVAVSAVLAGLLLPQPGATQQTDDVTEFMRAKLVHSQEVLEGLAVEDFEQIAKNSQDLTLLSQQASWRVLQTPEYMQRSNEFRRATEALTEAAREENLDAALVAYVDVTMKCVNCHKYVRRVRMADAGPPLGDLDVVRVAASP